MQQKRISIILSALLMGCLALSLFACEEPTEPAKPVVEFENVQAHKLADGAYRIDPYQTMNFELARQTVDAYMDNWQKEEGTVELKAAACTSIIRDLADGKRIVGHNLDSFISEYPVCVGEVQTADRHRVLFLSVLNESFPDHTALELDGLPEDLYYALPYYAADTWNDAGLFIATNTRPDEKNEKGEWVLASDGTNPNADLRLSASMLPMYLALQAGTVEEAVNIVKNLNVYSACNENTSYSIALTLLDRDGNAGILEIARNEVHYTPNVKFHTNFFIDETFAGISHYGYGQGRFGYVARHYKEIVDAESMQDALSALYYTGRYAHTDEWTDVDWRSECIGEEEKYTADYVLKDANEEEIFHSMNVRSFVFNVLPHVVKEKMEYYQETTFSLVLDTATEKMTVRFHENNEKNIVMDFTEGIRLEEEEAEK